MQGVWFEVSGGRRGVEGRGYPSLSRQMGGGAGEERVGGGWKADDVRRTNLL